IKGIVDGCDQASMLLVGGETAELPDLYSEKHFDIAGFAVGSVTRSTLLTGDSIIPGDKVIGVASSGIHANGFSLARQRIGEKDEMRQELLKPTLIYVKPVLKLFDEHAGAVKGLVHITGGGWRNLLRLNDKIGFRLTDPLPVPGVFQRLSERVSAEEMYKT